MNSEKVFPLKGYMLPLSPEGRSSLIDAPPWHYGGEVMHLIFRADEKRVKALLPPPLEIGPNPGEGVVWFVEWVSVSESKTNSKKMLQMRKTWPHGLSALTASAMSRK